MADEFTTATVTANGIKQHYYRTGTPGRPTLILLHGVTDNGMCWVQVARALSDQYDIYMPDARGHGFSDAPDRGYGAMDRAADAAGFIETLDLDRPIVFGHSMGAETALALAARWPALVRAVVLEDPPWRPREAYSPERRAEAAQNWRTTIQANREKSIAQLVEQVRTENPTWPEEELLPWAESKRQVSSKVVELYEIPRIDWRDLLPDVQCPVLLITADPERGAIVRRTEAEQAETLNSNVRVVNVPGAGHCIHRERFNQTMQAVKSFLSVSAP